MANKKVKRPAGKKSGKAIELTLTTTARSNIAATYCDAASTQDRSGHLLTTVCDAVYKVVKGKPLPDGDRADIVRSIGVKRGWSKASHDVRAAEVNTVLKNYAALREAIKALTTATDACTWHQAIELSRLLNRKKTVKAAVAEVKRVKQTGPKGTPSGRLAGALLGAVKFFTGKRKDAVVSAGRALHKIKVVTFTGKAKDYFV
mgnify:CR=1 FL=1